MKILTNLHAKIKSAYRSEQSWKQAHSKAFQCIIELYREHFYHYLGLEYEIMKINLENVIKTLWGLLFFTCIHRFVTQFLTRQQRLQQREHLESRSWFYVSLIFWHQKPIFWYQFLDFWYQELKFLISINQLKVLDIKNSFSNIRKSFFDTKISNLM